MIKSILNIFLNIFCLKHTSDEFSYVRLSERPSVLTIAPGTFSLPEIQCALTQVRIVKPMFILFLNISFCLKHASDEPSQVTLSA